MEALFFKEIKFVDPSIYQIFEDLLIQTKTIKCQISDLSNKLYVAKKIDILNLDYQVETL